MAAYDTRDLEKKRNQFLAMIGSRIVQVKKAGLADLSRDDKLVEMIDDVAEIDRAIASVKERKPVAASGCGREGGCGNAHACRGHAHDPAAGPCD
jgi:TPP-dependent indolepyruvate ferredoxin oxidoreductase alpha subunit